MGSEMCIRDSVDNKTRVIFSALILADEHSQFPVTRQVLSGQPKPSQHIMGHIEVVFDATEIESVTSNYTGLGDTGEVIAVMLRPDDSVMILNDLRHEAETNQIAGLANSSAAMRHVMSGKSGIVTTGIDYRGQEVLASTRFIEELDWGLIVKVDKTEEDMRADTLLDSMFDIGLALSAFAIIGGTLLGFYLARPIHDLAVLLGRIRHGETTLRANTEGDDEIAYLAETLNELLDHMPPAEETKQDV